ncbi:MAG: HEAT repeat domain-containing protein [Planctomycetes bacterium]|nr:HEAT repeat domain-containing protein [Planctomycetota bacterium]
MRFPLLIPAFLIAASATLSAEEVVLKDGKKLYGEVQREGDAVVVTDFQGRSVVLTDEVAEIRPREKLLEEYGFFLEKLGPEPNHFDLGCWCWKRGLFDQARGHFQKMLEKDPENACARWALGQVKVRGVWIPAGVWTRLPGPKEEWVRFVPGGEGGKLQVHTGDVPNDAVILLRKAAEGDAAARAEAEAAFAKLPERERSEGLLLALRDRSFRLREHAAAALRSVKGLEAAKALTFSALGDPVGDVRVAALESLTAGGFPEACDLVLEGLASQRFPVRMNALAALGGFPTREAVHALCAMAESSGGLLPRVNIFIGSHTAYVRDFDVEVAQMSAIGDPVLATALEGVVLDVRVVSVQERFAYAQRAVARRSMSRIAGKDLGADTQVWRKWAEEKFGARAG